MSVNKLGIILFSGVLTFATAPFASAQSTTTQDTTTKKQSTTTQKSTTNKDTGKTTEKKSKKTTTDTQSTSSTQNDNKAANADKSANSTADKSTTPKEKSSSKKGTKKTSAVSNDKIRQTQSALKKDGFDPGPVDGIMGPLTMTALRNFQSHNHLEVTGTITPETESMLMGTASTSSSNSSASSYRSQTQQQTDQSLNQTQPSTSQDLSQNRSTREALGVGAAGTVSEPEDVRQIQQALADMQYNPGEVNGMMSSQTQQAIREFQWLNDLPVTGNLDEQTKISINNQMNTSPENAKLNTSTSTSNIERSKPETTVPESSVEGQSQTRSSSSSTYSPSTSTTAPSTQRDSSYENQTSTHDKSIDSKKDKSSDKDKEHKLSKDTSKEASERIQKSAAVLQDLTAASDKRIPNELLERAEAIAVIPNMIKGAFGIGGRYGKGVVSQRLDNGRWSAPAFLQIGGGSFGAQIGVTSTDLVLVFTDKKALDQLEHGKDLKLGADASVAAGPIGRSAEAGVNAKLESAIYAYSRAKGLFAGIALDGAVLDIDNSMNEKVYGVSDARQIWNGKTSMNSTVRPFVDALDKVVPAKRLTQK
jgi:lipid-binding SYLF domain-containing protein/peptidoglycan hydrolase-like protein with peptidoglycan-binding domain